MNGSKWKAIPANCFSHMYICFQGVQDVLWNVCYFSWDKQGVSNHYMIDQNNIQDDEDFDDFEEISFSEFSNLDLTTLDENISYNIFEDNFPQCSITRLGDNLLIRIEEHIYTKYWFHKYHASVFATAMMKAIKRLQLEGIPLYSKLGKEQ